MEGLLERIDETDSMGGNSEVDLRQAEVSAELRKIWRFGRRELGLGRMSALGRAHVGFGTENRR